MSRYQCQHCGSYASAKGVEQATKLLRPICAQYELHKPRPLLDDFVGKQKQTQLGVIE